ncbi:hypothetical protein F2Q69_00052593 [Brassica cretica]|uniref:Uncharacterized protein n=1 Tax=Brassica cretica TaxID=69181 RepID=A0A8S9N7J3_BRACR|nr:hypothetical protein F2Q69_00052593 [Brassica cretica]
MARRSSGGWRLQSAFWGMVGDRFSLSDLVLLFLSVRRSVMVSSPGFRRSAALAQAVLGYGGLGSVWDVRRLQLLFARSGIVYSLGKLFLDGPLSLRVDHRGGQNYWGPDSRLNLAHSFAASCCCGHGRVCV